MQPNLSYTIWFSQRTGSTLLCQALESTGIAGKPHEWLHTPGSINLLAHYGVDSPAELQARLWQLGSTPNGVFGVKHSFYEPHFQQITQTLGQFPTCPANASRTAVWDHAFPNGRHIFMTRRNKVRLAVSWWKAIQTAEWHRQVGAKPTAPDLENGYQFAAIDHLFNECSMREAGIAAFFAEARIIPLTIVYEDFQQAYEETIQRVLDFLGLDSTGLPIPPPQLVQTADDISEQWIQRFREEKQSGWVNRGW